MNKTLGLLAALLMAGASIPYFKYQRQVQTPGSGGQVYIVVDETVWEHARPDLGDVRLFSTGEEVPYALQIESGGSETERKEFRVLQPATVGGKTQFLLDMSGVAEYDRVELGLATKNYVAHARVEGQDDPHGGAWAALGTTTLYDLSEEKLGHNSTLQIPLATYKFLRVTIDRAVKPSDVRSGTAGITRASKAVWRTINTGPAQTQQGQGQLEKDTLVTFSLPENVPVERLVLEIDATQPNFQREIELQGDNGQHLGTGEVRRIHMVRNGQKIDVEETSVEIGAADQRTLNALIQNGDDQPLKITGAKLQQYERRIYFDFAPGAEYTLYSGDKALNAPVYDYAKIFQRDAAASQTALGSEELNAAYTGRPDERPWSERHPALLWAAILAAVLVLGAIALNSMRKAN
ncbi:MAG: DUF3999 family protein [Candidatus Acidiferrales bacterium]